METKQISNYLVKLDGFTSGPDKRHSAMVTKPASEMQVLIKNSVEGMGISQVTESVAHAGLALSERKGEVTGNQSIDPGRGAQVSLPRDSQGELEIGSFGPRPSTEGRETQLAAGLLVDMSLG